LLDDKLITDYNLSKTVTALTETTWKLAAVEKALGEGPTLRNATGLWSNTTADITTRACQFDDQFIFKSDGTFQNILNENTWLEDWQGTTEGCGAPVAPHDGTAEATWLFNADNSSITITGIGAYLGIPGVHNNGGLSTPNDAVSPITYTVLFDDDIMYAFIDYGRGIWRFLFKKEPSLSLDEMASKSLFKVFPNPATTEIQIQSDEQISTLAIYDLTGKILLTQNALLPNDRVNISKLNSGLYILKIRINNTVSVKKLAIR